MTATKTIQSTNYKVTLLSTHIIENEFFDKVIIDIPLISEVKKINTEFADGKPYGVLTLFGPETEITPEARAFISREEFHQGNVCTVIITAHIAQKIITNFYLKFNKPTNNTRAFNTKEAGLQWLEKEMELYLK